MVLICRFHLLTTHSTHAGTGRNRFLLADMQPCKSDSFRFHRNTEATSSGSSTESSSGQRCRRRLREKFDESRTQGTRAGERRVLSVLSLNDNTRRVLRSSAERLSKTFNSVRTTLGTLSQRFKTSTKRRQILQEGPMTPNPQTPYSFSKQILGRTPTKLYSPFGIDSPYNNATTIDKENLHPNSLSLIKLRQ
ncbi:uncharacterized protein LOC132706818 [Cylas formicarius]|uniref:uncharacterized protein LOC132706818 n=1 Tax=Cylas formicarius TaxID=197179 RepID=UPI0029586D9C|nr:uncharacterized protein LOC132706818 [Cylas formicarius]